jgi:F420-non-reducing hydrogenase iron-sulfur subunit
MDAYGLEPERFRLVWCSSAEADRFVAAVTGMTETVRKMGPNPFRRIEPEHHEEVA